ncbi:anthrax toxin-like adenylyl cyclase domain-containing protein [Novosphingobium soli]|uniref:Anthrax toxin-like adenylyl cyclase domain-containing protein n=1 Tax=Novosphingobium soli TaxID=574956 RepID=A0ABV6CUZ4_9SPHN
MEGSTQSLCEEVTGIPILHQNVFQSVADRTGNIIASRAVGIYATGLILENYASKGFHNKAKSCNWGPMAGFVLDDVRFTKVGGTAEGQRDQRKALIHAIDDGAMEVPLIISDERRQWLLAKGLIKFVDRDSNSLFYAASSGWRENNVSMTFKLLRERVDGAPGVMWSVHYKGADRRSAADTVSREWTPVIAMRDPMCPLPPSDYHSATTGDYDLFMVLARTGTYAPDGADRRKVGVNALEAAIRAGGPTGEDAHLGNITGRIAQVRMLLNIGFVGAGYRGGNMVHHSDEGGRPFVDSVDLPVFAVVPFASKPFLIRSIPDLRHFIATVTPVYAPVFNPGWMSQLVHGSWQWDRNAQTGRWEKTFTGDRLRSAIRGFDRTNRRHVP